MLPLTKLARRAWDRSRGDGAIETDAQYTPNAFHDMLKSPFSTAARAVTETRTFEVAAHVADTGHGPQQHRVLVHTCGRRPSACTIRTLRATISVLTAVYGAYPHARDLEVFLYGDPKRKVLPQLSRPVTVDHINSGFSSASRVVVYRCSEMHRTIVHELVHVWKAHGRDIRSVQLRARKTLGAPESCLLTEAFVEAVTWLIYGGFCSSGLDPGFALRVAKAYLDARDDGRTNGWAYFVGKALLVSDGGRAFHASFFRGPENAGVRLVSAEHHRCLVSLMERACGELGGPSLDLVTPWPRYVSSPILCNCSLGPAFADERRRCGSGRA